MTEHHSRNGFLTRKGYQLAEERGAQRELKLKALAAMDIVPQVDKVGSVSALVEVEDLYAFVIEDMTDDQYRRYHNVS